MRVVHMAASLLAGAWCFAGAAGSVASPSAPAPATGPVGTMALPPAAIDPALNIGGEDVKAKRRETRLSVEVGVNGRGPYRFIVDSGADTSAIDAGIAASLDLPLTSPTNLNSMTGRTLVDRVRVAELGLGKTAVHGLELAVLRQQDMGDSGILGIDALLEQRLMMDFDKKIIRIEDGRTKAKRMPGEIVITARRQRGQLILTEVTAGQLRLDAVVDTGSEITVGNSALKEKLKRKKRATFNEVELVGVTGDRVKVTIGVVSELQIGSIVAYDVPIAFADLPPFRLFGLTEEPALLLGTDILSNFRRVSLDFWHRKARFQLRTCNTEGVIMSFDPNSFSRLAAPRNSDACAR